MHANKGNRMGLPQGWTKVTERYYQVRWSGRRWRGQRYLTREPHSQLAKDVPGMVGRYCAGHNLTLNMGPAPLAAYIQAAMDEEEREEAAAGEGEAEEEEKAAASGRPSSRTPVPEVDAAELAKSWAEPIGGEEKTTRVKGGGLPLEATAAQRAAHDAVFMWNQSSKQVEHITTIVSREQKARLDTKLSAGRAKYRDRTRRPCISEDVGIGTGYWVNGVYQLHEPDASTARRELATRGGPLLLEGTLAVGLVRVLELRKGVGGGTLQQLRGSVRQEAAQVTEAVVQPLVRGSAWYFLDDLQQRPRLVPVVCLGCAVRTTVRTPGTCAAAGEYEVGEVLPNRGGPRLEPLKLTASLFGARVMVTEGAASLEGMRVKGLKHELKARGESRGGTKHVLQRRLHGLLVRAAIVRQKRHRKRPRTAQQERHADIFGSDDSDYPSSPGESDDSSS